MSLGTDLYCDDDLTPELRVATVAQTIAQAVYRRWITPPGDEDSDETGDGSLFGDEEYGLGLRQWIGRSLDPGEVPTLAGLAEEQALRDERIASAQVTATYDAAAEALTLRAVLTTEDEDELRLTVTADQLTTELLFDDA